MVSPENEKEDVAPITSSKGKLGAHDMIQSTKRETSPANSDTESKDSAEEGELDERNDTIPLADGSCDNKTDATKPSAPPLPTELPPATREADDGWSPIWEETAQGFYFYNRFTGASQWTNPRVPQAVVPQKPSGPPGVDAPSSTSVLMSPPPVTVPGYNPAIHGDYDPNAWYAQPLPTDPVANPTNHNLDPSQQYAATAAFNRFTGRFQSSEITPENFNDENKSKRQMNAYFDVDAAANSHDGRSLKAERSGKKLSKTELKQFKEKRKIKKEEKRRAWLRD
ncbi:unnamed protein product [Blumeria hordei]|uniref:WW domain-containing protein n=2 Tax=Blumeria hordei TaxID=2867405 RepID=A0A383UIA0_BLUHO|nr:WW domain containing protein [Blumeria hordei DH14]SZF00021.1 unnamed protein product [Blumeria hordei]